MAGTVCLTFDFDALSLWINRRQTSPASLSRGEFGAVAVPRILHLLSTYDIPSTWFIPGHTIETYRSHYEEVVKAGYEIGLHGYLHEHVVLLLLVVDNSSFSPTRLTTQINPAYPSC